jgi:hypothetical protein
MHESHALEPADRCKKGTGLSDKKKNGELQNVSLFSANSGEVSNFGSQ